MNSGVFTWQELELYFSNYTSSINGYTRPATKLGHKIYLPAMYCILLVIGILGNAWVVYVIACVQCMGTSMTNRASRPAHPNTVSRRPSGHERCTLRTQPYSNPLVNRLSRTSRNVQIYIICICSCDMVTLVFLCFLIADLITGQWPIRSAFLCKAYMASESVNKFCIPFLLVALSGYCYATIAQCDSNRSAAGNWSKPNKSRKQWMICKSPFLSAFICVCAGLCLVTPMYLYSGIRYIIAFNATTHEPRWIMSKCGFHPPDIVFTVFTLYSVVCGYVLPSVLFTCFYSSVLRVVYRRAKRENARMPRTYRLSSVAKTTMGLVFFYQLCWTPYWTMNLFQYLYGSLNASSKIPPFVVELLLFVHTLPYINCTGYPIVYTLMNKNIKEAYHRIREARRLGGVQSAQNACACELCQSRSESSTRRVYRLIRTCFSTRRSIDQNAGMTDLRYNRRVSIPRPDMETCTMTCQRETCESCIS